MTDIEQPIRRSTFIPLPDDAARPFAREYREGVAAVRGLMFAVLLSSPVWLTAAVVPVVLAFR